MVVQAARQTLRLPTTTAIDPEQCYVCSGRGSIEVVTWESGDSETFTSTCPRCRGAGVVVTAPSRAEVERRNAERTTRTHARCYCDYAVHGAAGDPHCPGR